MAKLTNIRERKVAKVLWVTKRLILAPEVSCKTGQALSVDERGMLTWYKPGGRVVIAMHGGPCGQPVSVQLPNLGEDAKVLVGSPVRADWFLHPEPGTGLWCPTPQDVALLRVRAKGTGRPGDLVEVSISRVPNTKRPKRKSRLN